MTQLLISVRSVAEAEAAIAGGAEIIDIKEPARGSLGRADDAVVRAIVEHVAGRQPISMALGELLDDPGWPDELFTGLVKIGLAGCRDTKGLSTRLYKYTTSFPNSCLGTKCLSTKQSFV